MPSSAPASGMTARKAGATAVDGWVEADDGRPLAEFILDGGLRALRTALGRLPVS